MFVLAALHQALQQCYLQSFALFYSAKNIAELLPQCQVQLKPRPYLLIPSMAITPT